MSAVDEQILIIGTGFAGLGMGIRLKQAGIHDFTILEKASTLGGTWRDNAYPGAACDVPSHLYSFSFEPNPEWTRAYASQEEIHAYMKKCAEKYGLLPHLTFNAKVTRATFDAPSGLWSVETADGVVRRARVLISGCGGLSRAAFPDIPGLASFEGKLFHSAQWDHSFDLDGKTVGVVGTGASAIQIVPAIAPRVKALHLFQRTPPWILPKEDRPIRDVERAIFRRAPIAQKLARALLYWGNEARAIAFVRAPGLMKKFQPLALDYLHARVKDPVLREKLTPKYTIGCKRVLLSNDYFETLQRPNVDVVTTGIDAVTPRGVRTRDGVERPLDALILATGFQAAEAAAPFEVRGLGGADLNETWLRGAEAYLGATVSGFPNFFMIIGPNTGLGHSSMILMIESQVAYVVDAIRTIRAQRLKHVDVRPSVQAAYNADVQARLEKTIWHIGGCSSWYKTKDGKNTTLWPGFTFEFRRMTRKFDPASYALTARDSAGDSNVMHRERQENRHGDGDPNPRNEDAGRTANDASAA